MNSSNQDKAELQNAILEKRALIVAGTGVSISASYDAVTKQSHPEASWAGLLENGLQWLKEHKLMDEDIVDSHLKLLKKNPQTHRFISAAEDIVTGMGGVDSVYFVDWLANTVGKIKANDRNLLDAIEALRVQGNILATTNYDGLLLGNPALLTPITWQDSDAIVGAMRKRDTSNVIFLHGYWRKPASVILDWKSYDQIARDQNYRDDLVACWKTSTWIYVGCGVSGLNDPDFGLLLERYGQRARDAGHWDYCLVREDQRDAFQAHFEKNNFNIRAVSFGKNHGDLPQ